MTITVAASEVYVPLGGNAWIKGGSTAKVTEQGVVGWSNATETIEIYVRFAKSGNLNVSLHAKSEGKSQLDVSVFGKSKKVALSKSTEKVLAGKWNVKKPGYVKIIIRGISKSTSTFAEIKGISVDGSAIDENTAFVKENKDGYFYWGRRGPSTHLTYTMPVNEDVEWFYNEVTVPEKQDVIGSYFMANGFGEGYFGMQVNS